MHYLPKRPRGPKSQLRSWQVRRCRQVRKGWLVNTALKRDVGYLIYLPTLVPRRLNCRNALLLDTLEDVTVLRLSRQYALLHR